MRKHKAFTVTIQVSATVEGHDENDAVNVLARVLNRAVAKVSGDYTLETQGVETLEAGQVTFTDLR